MLKFRPLSRVSLKPWFGFFLSLAASAQADLLNLESAFGKKVSEIKKLSEFLNPEEVAGHQNLLEYYGDLRREFGESVVDLREFERRATRLSEWVAESPDWIAPLFYLGQKNDAVFTLLNFPEEKNPLRVIRTRGFHRIFLKDFQLNEMNLEALAQERFSYFERLLPSSAHSNGPTVSWQRVGQERWKKIQPRVGNHNPQVAVVEWEASPGMLSLHQFNSWLHHADLQRHRLGAELLGTVFPRNDSGVLYPVQENWMIHPAVAVTTGKQLYGESGGDRLVSKASFQEAMEAGEDHLLGQEGGNKEDLVLIIDAKLILQEFEQLSLKKDGSVVKALLFAALKKELFRAEERKALIEKAAEIGFSNLGPSSHDSGWALLRALKSLVEDADPGVQQAALLAYRSWALAADSPNVLRPILVSIFWDQVALSMVSDLESLGGLQESQPRHALRSALRVLLLRRTDEAKKVSTEYLKGEKAALENITLFQAKFPEINTQDLVLSFLEDEADSNLQVSLLRLISRLGWKGESLERVLVRMLLAPYRRDAQRRSSPEQVRVSEEILSILSLRGLKWTGIKRGLEMWSRTTLKEGEPGRPLELALRVAQIFDLKDSYAEEYLLELVRQAFYGANAQMLLDRDANPWEVAAQKALEILYRQGSLQEGKSAFEKLRALLGIGTPGYNSALALAASEWLPDHTCESLFIGKK